MFENKGNYRNIHKKKKIELYVPTSEALPQITKKKKKNAICIDIRALVIAIRKFSIHHRYLYQNI